MRSQKRRKPPNLLDYLMGGLDRVLKEEGGIHASSRCIITAIKNCKGNRKKKLTG